MSNGLGAAFGGLVLMAVVAGLACLLAVSFVAGVVVGRQTERVHAWGRNLSVVLLAGVVVVAGFAVVALYDEAPQLAAVFVGTVFVPLCAVGVYLHRMAGISSQDAIVRAGVAWSGPFLLGLAVTFAIPPTINSWVGLSPGEARQLGVYWGTTAVGASVVLLGAVWVAGHVGKPMSTAPTD